MPSSPSPHRLFTVLIDLVQNAYNKTTRGKSGFKAPKDVFDLQVTSSSPPDLSPILKNYKATLAHPHCCAAMVEEFNVLTWDLAARFPSSNVVIGKWIFPHLDGLLAHYKAWWVVREFPQQAGIDYDKASVPL